MVAKEKTEKHLSKVVEWFLGPSTGWVASQLSQIEILHGFLWVRALFKSRKAKNLHAFLLPASVVSWIWGVLSIWDTVPWFSILTAAPGVQVLRLADETQPVVDLDQ